MSLTVPVNGQAVVVLEGKKGIRKKLRCASDSSFGKWCIYQQANKVVKYGD